ncbi:MAG TPA: ATP-binding protein, partial [Burkholderiaceae bacterium]|nr:ATP-binding protein [Burkholderiaceae bacterium]
MAAPKKTKPVEVMGELEPMLTRLKLTAIRDQLDTLLDQAGRAELNLREALTMLCTAEVARKDERRIQMGMSIAKFP